MPLLRLEMRHLFIIIIGMTLLFGNVIVDPDFFFHLKAGEDILRTWSIPATDSYSFTHHGGAWQPHEWLAAVILYLVHTHFGLLGIKLFIAAMGIAALFTSAAALSRKRSLELPLIAGTALLLAPFLKPRPQLFTYLFFAIYLFSLLRYKYRHEVRHLWGLPLLMVAWVNLHGGYLLGIAMLGAFIASEWFSAWLAQTPPEQRLRLRPLIITLLAVVVASLLNPWGVEHWLFPFRLMGSNAIAYISEWQPLDLHSLLGRGFVAWVALLLVAYIYAPRRPDLTELLLPWSLVVAALSTVRHLPLAILAMLPFLGLKVTAWAAAVAQSHHPWLVRLRSFMAGGGELGGKEILLNWLVLGVVAVLFAVSYPAYHADDEAKLNARVPARATDFIVASGLAGRMFNTYHYGGYLIYRLAPEQQVFIDIRGDMYSRAVLDDYRTIYQAKPGWRARLDHYAIDYIICEANAPLVEAATSSGDFVAVYRDQESTILVRRDERYRSFIVTHPLS